jgi:hypothetical protein
VLVDDYALRFGFVGSLPAAGVVVCDFLAG